MFLLASQLFAKKWKFLSNAPRLRLYISNREIHRVGENIMETATIESKFIFKTEEKKEVSYISDDEGQRIGFSKLDNGSNVIYTQDLEGIDVAIEHCADGTKIFHMAKDSKGLPAMHEIKPDGSEVIYLFDANKSLEKTIEMKSNGDKVTKWYSPEGDVITQEQRQKGGIVFQMVNKDSSEATIWLQTDGKVVTSGETKHLKHIQKVFAKFLDGIELE